MDTKALRQKILDLAIRGKLVPQDPNDEPAVVLLKRIRAEKQQMVKDGKLKPKDIKNDTVIFKGDDNLHYEKFSDGSVKLCDFESDYEIPNNWVWCNLGLLFNHNTGKALNSANSEGKALTYITTSNVYWNRFELNDLKSMPFTDSEIEKCTIKKGDLLVCEGGDIGRAAIWNFDNEIRIQNHLHRLRAYDDIQTAFYYYVLYAFKLSEKISGNGIGLQGLSSNALHNIIVPVPPIEEQKNIVMSIEKLMLSIDNIESHKNILAICIENTKAKILDLAIRGKLVPQDPNDEPASVLLERIRAEKEELIKQGKIKRNKKESIIFKSSDNSYYLRTGGVEESLEDWRFDDLPETWKICCLWELCDYGDCINVNTEDIAEDAWILDLEDIEKDTGTVLKKVTKAQRNSVSTKHKFHSRQVLYSKLRPYLNKVVLSDSDGYCTSEILPLEFKNCVLPEYARYYLMSGTFIAYANHCSYGVKMPRLGTTDGKKAIFSLPPLSEQKRIVETIDFCFMQLNIISEALA